MRDKAVLTEVVRLDSEFLFKGDGQRGAWFSADEPIEPLHDIEMEGQAGWPKSPEVADRIGPILSCWWEQKVPLKLMCLNENILFIDGDFVVTLPRTQEGDGQWMRSEPRSTGSWERSSSSR